MAFTIHADDCPCIGQAADSLLRPEMKLHSVSLVVCVDQAERMAAEAMHVAVGGRNPPIAHNDRAWCGAS